MSVPPGMPIKGQASQPINGEFQISINDFDDLSLSLTSFPSIHFGGSSSQGSGEFSAEDDSSSSEEQDEFAGLFKGRKSK